MSHRRSPPRLPAVLARSLLTPDDADRLIHALDDEYGEYQIVQRTPIGADLWYWRQFLRSLPSMRRRSTSRGNRGSLVDLLHLGRQFRRSPISAGAAVLTLTLTLGAGTAILAVVDAVLLQPPPFEDPDALVTVGVIPVGDPTAAPRAVDHDTYVSWRERSTSLAALEAFDPTNLMLSALGAPERVGANNVTPGLLALLGVTPALGRLFGPEDQGQPLVIVSSRLWRDRFGADPDVIGRELFLGGEAHTVLGVLPEQFSFALNPSDVWRPLPFGAVQADDGGDPVRVVARLVGQASPNELAGLLEEATGSAPLSARVRVIPIRAAIAGDSSRTLGLLAGAASLAMLIAFTNLAVLLMVRSIDRRRELAVRSALGAHPSETARQLLLEALALVGAGTLGGVLLAVWTTPVVGRLASELGGLSDREIGVSWPAIGGVFTIAFVCACVCGLLPALGSARWRIGDVLRQGATASAHELRLRRLFVTGEVALAFALLVSMSLLGRSLLDVLRTHPGFDARDVVKLQVSLPAGSYPDAERTVVFYSALQSALQERLGPQALSIIDEVPLTGDGGRSLVGLRRASADREAVVRATSPGYFDVFRIPLLAGRSFDWTDGGEVPPRVVITQSLVDRLFGSEQPVGRRIWLAGIEETAEIVGVVGDVKHRALDEVPLPTVYLSGLQFPSASSIIVVRSTRPPDAVVAVVREEVARLDAGLPVYGVQSMQDVVASSPGVPERRLLTATLTGFALLAVLLSAIGLFGVAAHDAARQRTEHALRLALGADPMRILRATLRDGAWTMGLGLAIGGVLSVLAVRGLSHLVVATARSQVLGMAAAAAVVLLATGMMAVLPAALSAARSDPLIAFRSE